MAIERLLDDPFQRDRVVDTAEPFGPDDLLGRAPRFVHLLEHGLGRRSADRPGLGERDQTRQRVRRQAGVRDADAQRVQLVHQLAHDPVAGRLGVARSGRRGLEEIGERS